MKIPSVISNLIIPHIEHSEFNNNTALQNKYIEKKASSQMLKNLNEDIQEISEGKNKFIASRKGWFGHDKFVIRSKDRIQRRTQAIINTVTSKVMEGAENANAYSEGPVFFTKEVGLEAIHICDQQIRDQLRTIEFDHYGDYIRLDELLNSFKYNSLNHEQFDITNSAEFFKDALGQALTQEPSEKKDNILKVFDQYVSLVRHQKCFDFFRSRFHDEQTNVDQCLMKVFKYYDFTNNTGEDCVKHGREDVLHHFGIDNLDYTPLAKVEIYNKGNSEQIDPAWPFSATTSTQTFGDFLSTRAKTLRRPVQDGAEQSGGLHTVASDLVGPRGAMQPSPFQNASAQAAVLTDTLAEPEALVARDIHDQRSLDMSIESSTDRALQSVTPTPIQSDDSAQSSQPAGQTTEAALTEMPTRNPLRQPTPDPVNSHNGEIEPVPASEWGSERPRSSHSRTGSINSINSGASANSLQISSVSQQN